jgi:hypothetical protein
LVKLTMCSAVGLDERYKKNKKTSCPRGNFFQFFNIGCFLRKEETHTNSPGLRPPTAQGVTMILIYDPR